MYKLYCLSYHYKVRWSYSGKFQDFSGVVNWLKTMKIDSFWGDNTKYYKVVSPDGNIKYIEVTPFLFKDHNYLCNVSLGYICFKNNLYVSLLK